MDKVIEKWLKGRSDGELYSLHALIRDKDKQLWQKIGYFSFTWVTNECKEPSDLKNSTYVLNTDTGKETKSENIVNAQFDCIEKYRKSGICTRCRSKLSGIVAKYKEYCNENPDVYAIESLFLTIHGYSGLCIDCIGEFLLNKIGKSNV